VDFSLSKGAAEDVEGNAEGEGIWMGGIRAEDVESQGHGGDEDFDLEGGKETREGDGFARFDCKIGLRGGGVFADHQTNSVQKLDEIGDAGGGVEIRIVEAACQVFPGPVGAYLIDDYFEDVGAAGEGDFGGFAFSGVVVDWGIRWNNYLPDSIWGVFVGGFDQILSQTLRQTFCKPLS
jgi:hypothetical protein